MAGRERKRGECQTRLGLVWRETGAVRNARPSRGQAAATRKRAQWRECVTTSALALAWSFGSLAEPVSVWESWTL